nr:hypothetical protein [Isorropodon fossajaponicum symbiont]
MNKVWLVFAGAIASLAFAPFNYSFILLISYAILFWQISVANTRKQAFFGGFIFAFSHYLIGLYWLFSIVSQYEFFYQVVVGIITAIAFFYGLVGYFAKLLTINHWSWFVLFYLVLLVYLNGSELGFGLASLGIHPVMQCLTWGCHHYYPLVDTWA